MQGIFKIWFTLLEDILPEGWTMGFLKNVSRIFWDPLLPSKTYLLKFWSCRPSICQPVSPSAFAILFWTVPRFGTCLSTARLIIPYRHSVHSTLNNSRELWKELQYVIIETWLKKFYLMKKKEKCFFLIEHLNCLSFISLIGHCFTNIHIFMNYILEQRRLHLPVIV